MSKIKSIIFKMIVFLLVIGIVYLYKINYNKSDLEIYYKSDSSENASHLISDSNKKMICLRNIENDEYVYKEVKLTYRVINLFNENRNALPTNYYIGIYSNFNIDYFNEENNIVNCIIEDFDGDEKVFLNCFVSTLFLNGSEKVFVKINGTLYVFDSIVPLEELNK